MTSTSTTAAPARPATPPTRPAPTTGQYMARAFREAVERATGIPTSVAGEGVRA